MKRFISFILVLTLIFAVSGLAEEQEKQDSFLDSASQFFSDAWNNTSTAVSNAWTATGDALSSAWNSVSGAVSSAWNAAGTFLGEKGDQLAIWVNISGNDALEKLKPAYNELAEQLQINSAHANDIWLQAMDYADQNGIAHVTQAKLLLAALTYVQADGTQEDPAQAAFDMIINSGITHQAAAENALNSMMVGISGTPSAPDPNEPRQYIGEVINTGTDNGFSGFQKLDSKDPHFGWTLGDFFVSGYTRVTKDENGNLVFLKTLDDQVELWFELKQDIDCLNGNDSLSIAEDKKAFDEAFGITQTNFGRGALVVRHRDYQNAAGTPNLYTDYLPAITSSGANTTVQTFEEGDYEVALNYVIKDASLPLISTYEDYRISFNFSVRNGNCMVFPFDVLTSAELTNTAVTENGFYLDLARSRYLDINVKRETLAEGAVGLTEDVRFNRPAKDGDQYTAEGIYTITVSNRYTGQETVKQIYVGTNKILMAHMVTGLSIDEIQEQLAKGAQIAEDGTIIGLTHD